MTEKTTNCLMPSAYAAQYEAARKFAPEGADSYLRHASLGDPELDPVMEELAPDEFPPEELHRCVQAGIEGEAATLARAPQALRELFDRINAPPPWLDHEVFAPGVRRFNACAELMIVAFLAGVMVEGLATLSAKSFRLTGRAGASPRRLQQNSRHLVEVFYPGGLRRDNDGWKLSVRIRFVHARIRNLLARSGAWDHAAWGTPLSAANLGFAVSVFSKRLLDYSQLLGANFNAEERASVMAVWRYVGYLMGIPETILCRSLNDAQYLHRLALSCEPPPDADATLVSNAIIRSLPEVAGIEKAAEREKFIALAYRLSRALIGDELADRFEYPKSSAAATLLAFRLKHGLLRLLRRAQLARTSGLARLLQFAEYDREGVSYRMPDHYLHEKSGKW